MVPPEIQYESMTENVVFAILSRIKIRWIFKYFKWL